VIEVQTLAADVATRPLLRRVTLDRNVTLAGYRNENPLVTVYGNLIDATEGKSEAPAALGNGDSRLVFQTFKIPKAPLTYHVSESATPPEVPELQIYVNNRLWKRVSSFFSRGPAEEIYLVREDEDNNSWVQFGDGKTGARLPSGIKNVVARFRTGTGAFGPMKANSKPQAGGRLDGLDKVQLLDVASGGSEPEDGENARQAAPGKIQSLDRLVSLADFESEALGIAGVVKAAAAWDLVNNIPQVVLNILMDSGRDAELEAVRDTIAEYNRGRGPNRFPVSVAPDGRRKYVAIDATYGFDPTFLKEEIESAIRVALGVNSGKPNAHDDQNGLFGLHHRGFGQREYASTIAGTIQQVPGVVWAQVTRFEALGVGDPATLIVPETVGLQPAVACESNHVLSLYSGHLKLTGVAETGVS
jgi:predicted phage baseplate assembly protein